MRCQHANYVKIPSKKKKIREDLSSTSILSRTDPFFSFLFLVCFCVWNSFLLLRSYIFILFFFRLLLFLAVGPIFYLILASNFDRM